MNREEMLERVRRRDKPWDIVVIGGGATGAGCALDAASRGLDVLLVEQHDFGKGTSSRSTKLIHGGVRYLAQGNLSLVRESLRERSLLLRNAPHGVRSQAFVLPCYGTLEKLYYGAGLKLYDLIAGEGRIQRSSFLSARETADRVPTLTTAGLAGGILYYDCQFDDARLLIDIIRTAHKHGAAALNYAKVVAIAKHLSGKAVGVEFEDVIGGERLFAESKVIVNATGAFCDGVRKMADSASEPIVELSQGIHLVFDGKFMPSDSALIIPKTDDGRVLFCIPWLGKTLVGTTDTKIESVSSEPAALEGEIDFVLETVGRYLREPPSRDDIRSVFAGIRPLVRSTKSGENTSKLARDHAIEIDSVGMVTVTGGKWTTYRRMAEEAVDAAIETAALPAGRSQTHALPIEPPAVSSDGNAAQYHEAFPYKAADVVRAVRDEMAMTVEDVLARRTRALFLDAAAAIESSDAVAQIMGDEMKQGIDWKEQQIRAFRGLTSQYLPRGSVSQTHNE